MEKDGERWGDGEEGNGERKGNKNIISVWQGETPRERKDGKKERKIG